MIKVSASYHGKPNINVQLITLYMAVSNNKIVIDCTSILFLI